MKSWIKAAATSYLTMKIGSLLITTIKTLWLLVIGSFGSLARTFWWILHRIFLLLTGKYDPGSRDPIEDALYQRERCRRAKRALEDFTYMPKVRRRWKPVRLLAAAVVLSQLLRGSFAQPSTNRAERIHKLKSIIDPPPPTSTPTPISDYISAFSILVHTTEDADFEVQQVCAFDTDSKPIGLDSRASACLSNDRNDFEDDLVRINKPIKTFRGLFRTEIWRGTMRVKVEDDYGCYDVWRIPGSYYIPEGDMRLMSPQHWAQQRIKMGLEMKQSPAHVTTYGDHMKIVWNKGKSVKIVKIDPHTNVATFSLAPGYDGYKDFVQQAELQNEDKDPLIPDLTCAEEASLVSDDEASTTDQDHPDGFDWNEGWDEPVGHHESEGAQGSEGATTSEQPREISFDLIPNDGASSETVVEPDEEDKVQNLSAELLRVHHRFNHISFGKLQMMAKAGILPHRLAKCSIPACSACMYGKATRRPWRHKPKHEGTKPSKQVKYAGQCVSVDMLKSPTPGLIAQMAGWLTGKRYWYATVFVDHYSGLGYVHLQKTQTAKETLEGKALFERKCAAFGIQVEHYHADNGIFASLAWKEACALSSQGYSYSGVNAHFQSGVAERRIRELQDLSRTMLIHANARWPEAITAHLWPYALRLACEAYNESPTRKLKRSPVEIFTRTAVMPEPKLWRPFGCPVYVLDNALQNTGGKKHKWTERSKVGVYLGRSPFHARTIALVLNLETGRVSPQFHVSFDPSFQTMKQSFGGKSPMSRWQALCGFTRDSTVQPQQVPKTKESPVFTMDPPSTQETQQGLSQQLLDQPMMDQAGEDIATADDSSQSTLRRSNRTSKPVIGNRLVDALCVEVLQATVDDDGEEMQGPTAPAQGEIFAYSTLFPLFDDGDEDPLLAYAASADPDTLYHHEAMREPDADQFRAAMEKEFNDQWDNGNFSLKRRNEVPDDARILPSVWAFKRKRKVLTGEVYKHKARLNLDGSKQVYGLDYDQTYSPTASWPAIRLQLALTLVNNWYTKQIDYVQAFPQAPIQIKQYMKIPKGIHIEGVDDPSEWVLELHKNVYGGKAAGRQWYLYLKEKLESIGFERSSFDECVFYKGQCMYVLYTDDSILAGPDEEELNNIIKEIEAAKLGVTDEGDLSDFLGVHIERKDGEFHLTQPKLIESILEDLNLDGPDTKTKDIPMASSKLLSRHSDSPDFDQNFNYRRVIGKLNFLEQSTRGDISYATHMLARFSTCPKEEHGAAVKWLGRYLAKTKDKGLIMRPDPSKGMEIYSDADFAGAWDPELAGKDIDTARSRHGYIITYAGVPLVWKSQLQGEIALSSTESEFIGLSSALRTAIPLQHILNEMKQRGFDIVPNEPVIHCKAFEDNNGALAIAKVPRMRPRTKHINTKYFHFVEYTSREDAPFSFERIDTEEQPADMLTKPLAETPLERHRLWLLGW